MPIKTIFLDRDGVINKEVGYLYEIEKFEFIEGIFDACRLFEKIGFKIIIISNQSGISRGYYTKNDYEKLTSWILEEFKNNGISIFDTFYCPHSPDSVCNCRKPKPGMFLDAIKKHNINKEKSWMIGDKETDIIAANAAGINNTILVRSGHKINENNSKSNFIIDSINESYRIINLY